MRSDSMIIPAQSRGPVESGNGGYVCERLASYLPGCAAVRLKSPPPLETELRVEASDTEARLLHESRLIKSTRLIVDCSGTGRYSIASNWHLS